MAMFKCKMCGGSLEVQEGATTCTCDYCGTQQTIPSARDEGIQTLFNRANVLRMKAEFDKAEEIYEKILQQNEEEAEAYWGLILCKYGIEYVEDPTTYKRVPTCHRASYDSVSADEDYKNAIRYADMTQKGIYESEAAEIDEIQKGILALAQKEDPYDVFICYKETGEDGKRTQDSVIANDIYHQLTEEGYKVFYAAITLEDKLGRDYEPCIFSALNTAKVMLAIGTKPEYFNAVWVKNEWSRFLKIMKKDRSRLLIPCYRDMDPYELPEEFAHLQAQDMGKIGFINDLIRGIRKIVKVDEPEAVVKEIIGVNESINVEPLLKRVFMFLEDGDWEQADAYCEKVLDQDPENARAYLGKLMAEIQVRKVSDLGAYGIDYTQNKNYIKAMRFSAEKQRAELKGYVDQNMRSTPVNVFVFSKTGDGYAIDGVNSEEYETIVIPKQYNGEQVTTIYDEAFMNCKKLTSITIPNSVTYIGDLAFADLNNLESVTILGSVAYIGEYAFRGCEKLTNIMLPDCMTKIGMGAFKGCASLADENGFVIIRNVLLDYLGKERNITIANGVTSIGGGAFEDCENLESVTISDSVTSIGDNAFYDSKKLKSVMIPDSVTSIGLGAFEDCENLESVTIPDSVTSIGDYMFSGCKNLESVTIPDSVTSIGDYAFSDCKNLKNMANTDSVTYIGEHAFQHCVGLADENGFVIIGNVLCEYLGNNRKVTVPDGVICVGREAFTVCENLESILMPESVTSVGEDAFLGCDNLIYVTISDCVMNIGKSAFACCKKLKSIRCFGDYSKLESVFRVNNADDQRIMNCLEQGKKDIQMLHEDQKRKEQYIAERTKLQSELPCLKGIFTGKRRREIESRLLELENLLKQ